MKPDLYHNRSGVRDPVAAKAIREADRQPDNVENAIRRMKTIAGWHDCEVVNRIVLRDKKNRKSMAVEKRGEVNDRVAVEAVRKFYKVCRRLPGKL